MKQVVLITGANGMLAKHLEKLLMNKYSIRFLTRNVTQDNEYFWDLETKYIDPKALMGVHYIIHLAGSSIANKRWNEKRKHTILSSRVDSSYLLLEELKKHQIKIEGFISASAIGFYGTTTTDTIFNEESPKGSDYLSTVCSKWEHAAHLFKSEDVAASVSVVRIGIILSENGGALLKMVQPIKYGFGSGIGKGNQYMPWIHIQDLSEIFKFILEKKQINETFNAVSPEHTTNIEFTKKIAKAVNRKIILPNIPAFIMKILFGEMAILLLKGSRVSSEKIVKKGFKFKYENLDTALNNILKPNN
jgi:uncharacterized protein (TIGR01777 family)